MKVVFWIIVAVVAGFMAFQIYKLALERGTLEKEALEATAKLETLEHERAALDEERAYYADARNLSKELKSLFNYKKPGEHLLIIVPQKSD